MREIPRYGVIAVDCDFLARVLKAPKDARLEEMPLDALATKLLLPETYRIVGISHEMYRRVYLIGVESDELPETPVGAMPPTLLPEYQHDLHEDAEGTIHDTVRFLQMHVFTPPPDPWPVVG